MGFRYFCVASCNNNAIFVGFSLICLEGLAVCYFHSTYEFQSESTLYSSPECQGTPGSKQVPYLKLSDCNEIRTQARRNENNSRGGGGATNYGKLSAIMVGLRRKCFISNRLKRLEKRNLIFVGR